MYEKMEKLLEAAHVLHEKAGTSQRKKSFTQRRKGAKKITLLLCLLPIFA
jgi:hypothetical protein